MLIRINPDMFIDERFESVTVNEVVNEIFRTQKFKTKFPWRKDFKNKIVPSSSLSTSGDDFDLTLATINQLLNAFVLNERTGRTFNLSLTDKRIAACAITNKLQFSSTDKALVDFVEQQFDIENFAPLAIINDWLRKGLIVWNDSLQRLMEDWDLNEEPAQPAAEIEKFEKLTGFEYAGR